MRMPVDDLASYLVGEWRIEREIHDSHRWRIGSFSGAASFADEEGQLVYEESGTLAQGDYSGPATRMLHYRITGPGQANVYFDHGGFFHDLDLRTGHCTAEHPCRSDLYRGEFCVFDSNSWHQEWFVSGPEKRYTIATLLVRMSVKI